MSNLWPHLIQQAEKLLGGPAPFINFASLLSSEAGFLASRARRLASTVDHPFFSAIGACLRGRTTIPLFLSQNRSNRNPIQISPRPSGGLILLLFGQSYANSASASAKVINQHRSLAEIFETVHTAITFHKSLVDLSNNESKDNVWMKDTELVNKLAILVGDVLLASVSTSLAKFNYAQFQRQQNSDSDHIYLSAESASNFVPYKESGLMEPTLASALMINSNSVMNGLNEIMEKYHNIANRLSTALLRALEELVNNKYSHTSCDLESTPTMRLLINMTNKLADESKC